MSVHEVRFLPTAWLPVVPADHAAAHRSLTNELIRIQGDLDRFYSTKQALELGDASVYTGASGVAYMYWRVASLEAPYFAEQREALMTKAEAYSKVALRLAKPHTKPTSVSTLLTGAAGVWAVAAAIAFSRNETTKAAAYCKEALAFAPTCVREGVPSELLYGRAGFLSCLLFMAAHAGLQLKDVGEIVAGSVQLILQDGRALAETDAAADNAAGRPCAGFPLMWQWHDKRYLGAAHGLCGILTVLLHLRSLVVALGCDHQLQGTIDAILHVRLPSGNLPSSLGSTHDRLVHWCHGAPGFMPMVCAAASAYTDRCHEYLEAAAAAAVVINEHGLLKKGFGICHGVAGNGLALLCLSQNPAHLDMRTNALRFGMHTHAHIHTHTRTHTNTHSLTHTRTHAHMHTCVHTHTRKSSQTHTHTRTYTHIHTHALSNTHNTHSQHAHTQMLTHGHAHIHTYTHARTHKHKLSLSKFILHPHPHTHTHTPTPTHIRSRTHTHPEKYILILRCACVAFGLTCMWRVCVCS